MLYSSSIIVFPGTCLQFSSTRKRIYKRQSCSCLRSKQPIMNIFSALKWGNVEALERYYVLADWLMECTYAQWVPEGKVSSQKPEQHTLHTQGSRCSPFCIVLYNLNSYYDMWFITVVKDGELLEHQRNLFFQFHVSLMMKSCFSEGCPVLLCATISFTQSTSCPG